MLFTFVNRQTLALDVIRDRNPDFVTLADGAIRNGYTLKLMNRQGAARQLRLNLAGISPRKVVVIGLPDTSLPATVALEGDAVRTVRVLVTVARGDFLSGPQPVRFTLSDAAGRENRTANAIFVGGRQ